MRGKYDQVNVFLKVIDAVIAEKPEKTLNIVDCGCGRAYLTLAVYFYLTAVRGFEVRVCGIDRKAGVVATVRKLAEDLDVAERVTFIEGDIATAEPPFEPDMALSLHACDMATDEALARGIEWKCRYLLCAPCCQHELHKTLGDGGPMRAVLRQGILRERLADLLTDTFRAQLLRVLGFRVQVVEFVSAEATARNILLKAEFCVKPGQQAAVSDYLELRDFWKVTPWLETRMAGLLGKYLAKY
jgi:SAM-dependent methyltransferase